MLTIHDSTLGQIKAATALGALALAGLVAFAPPAAAQLTDTTPAACLLDLDGDGEINPGQSGQQSDGPGGAVLGNTDNAATACGRLSVATGDNSSAFGQTATATGDNSTAIGQSSEAKAPVTSGSWIPTL